MSKLNIFSIERVLACHLKFVRIFKRVDSVVYLGGNTVNPVQNVKKFECDARTHSFKIWLI